ncbi:MAG: site-2 protease family protein [Actinobacteria bacterium]|nr:site-2 protease family protein [Actinomycetota bacterium]
MDLSVTSVLFFVLLIPSVILHEVSHGVLALWFGDPTAKDAGRLTLNPIPHIDPFGTVLLPAILALTTGGVFGYAKPVPVRPGRMRRPRDHGLLVSLIGPVTNIVLAALAALVLRSLPLSPGSASLAVRGVAIFGFVNVILAAFNLIPIPPLDGSAVVERLLPRSWLGRWHELRKYSMGLLLILVLLVPGAFNRVFDVALRAWQLLL